MIVKFIFDCHSLSQRNYFNKYRFQKIYICKTLDFPKIIRSNYFMYIAIRIWLIIRIMFGRVIYKKSIKLNCYLNWFCHRIVYYKVILSDLSNVPLVYTEKSDWNWLNLFLINYILPGKLYSGNQFPDHLNCFWNSIHNRSNYCLNFWDWKIVFLKNISFDGLSRWVCI